MYVRIGEFHRIQLRPLWRAFVLSMVTGSIYQMYWLFATGRELRPLTGRAQMRAVLWPVTLLVTQVVALATAVNFSGSAMDWGILALATAVGAAAIYEAASVVGDVQRRAFETGGPRERIINPAIAAALFAVGVGIAAMGVQPGDPAMGAAGSPADRIFNAVTAGLLLPFWLLYLQHGLNRALLRMGAVTEAQEQFGALQVDSGTALIRARLAARGRPRETSEDMDIVPWATAALTLICTAVFAMQVARFGFALTLDEMVASGAGTKDLIREGEAWRLVTENLVHFDVGHWAFNMFALVMGGWVVERTIGHLRMVAVMILGAVGSSLMSWWGTSLVFGSAADAVVSGGESGIGFAIIGALLACDPKGASPVGRFGRWLTLIGVLSSLSPNVGVFAHLGGWIAGYLVVTAFAWHRGAPYVAPLGEDPVSIPTAHSTIARVPTAYAPMPVTPAMALPAIIPPPSLHVNAPLPMGVVVPPPVHHPGRHPAR